MSLVSLLLLNMELDDRQLWDRPDEASGQHRGMPAHHRGLLGEWLACWFAPGEVAWPEATRRAGGGSSVGSRVHRRSDAVSNVAGMERAVGGGLMDEPDHHPPRPQPRRPSPSQRIGSRSMAVWASQEPHRRAVCSGAPPPPGCAPLAGCLPGGLGRGRLPPAGHAARVVVARTAGLSGGCSLPSLPCARQATLQGRGHVLMFPTGRRFCKQVLHTCLVKTPT